jgi:hypothetical protein
VVIDLEVKSYLYTKFSTDGAYTDTAHDQITIYFYGIPEEEEEDETYYNRVSDSKYAEYEDILPPYITNIEITKIDSQSSSSALFKSKKYGADFICAGQTIRMKIEVENFEGKLGLSFDGDSSIFTFDSLTKQFEWDEPKSRNVRTRFSRLDDFKKMYSKNISISPSSTADRVSTYEMTYVIPYGTKQTLHSWSTLRKQSNDAFQIDENRLFTRIDRPYQLVFKAVNVNGADTKRVSLDVFERWDTLYNRDISKYIVK